MTSTDRSGRSWVPDKEFSGASSEKVPIYVPTTLILFVVIITCSPLAGCAQQSIVWTKSGANADDFEQDKSECNYQAHVYTSDNALPQNMGEAIGQGIANGMRIGELTQLCMRAHGWHPQLSATQACDGPPKLTCTGSNGTGDCDMTSCP